jgi:2'-5' RNA ligase
MSKTRTFIAVEALDAVQAAAVTAIDRLRGGAENVNWVDPENLHWTMQFLGDLTDQEMAEVCLRTLRAAAQHDAFELSALGVFAFPSIQRPRTLWLGAGEGRERLVELHNSIDDALFSLGFRRDSRDFTPHVTLGRVGQGAHAGPVVSERLAKLADYDGGIMEVAEVIVYASELTRDGPTYTVLARAPLAGG